MGNVHGLKNKKNIKRKIAYIIGHRSDGDYRDRNLDIVIKWLLDVKKLCANIELIIIVVEQDTIKKYAEPNGIEHIFIFNDGYYNRGWAFNVGFRIFSYADYFYFADNDIVLNNEDMIDVFNNCFEYNAVNPYKEIYDSENSMIIDPDFYPGNFTLNDTMKKRENTCFSGGIMGISRESMQYISGWDERFRGRGWEDYAFTSKLKLFLGDNLHVFNTIALHLWHPWEENTTREINQKLNEEYTGYKIVDYINQIYEGSLTFGNKNKYSRNEQLIFEENIDRIKIFINASSTFSKYKKIVKEKHKNIPEESILKFIYLNLCDQHICEQHTTYFSEYSIIECFHESGHCCIGPQGIEGPQGIQGIQGIQGQQGIQGPQGICLCKCK